MKPGLGDQELRQLVAAAVAAPSVHNSQPWRFVPRDGCVEVHADPSRLLDVVDPQGRELFISLGAAVCNLGVAMRIFGCHPGIRLLPSPEDRRHAATVCAGPPAPTGDRERALYAAIWLRHTQRGPFTDRVPDAATLKRVAGAAREEGAALRFLDPAERDGALGVVRSAETRLLKEPRYRLELHDWTSDDDARADGVPVSAFGPAAGTLPLRDYAGGRPIPGRELAVFETAPVIAVLATRDDERIDWLRAGMALEHVLLTATVEGLVASLFTQALELPDLRMLLTGTGMLRWPQAILRVGYGPAAMPTPRRPLEDVIDRRTR